MITLTSICDRCRAEALGEGAFALPEGWDFWKGNTLCNTCLPFARAMEFLQNEEVKEFMEELQ